MSIFPVYTLKVVDQSVDPGQHKHRLSLFLRLLRIVLTQTRLPFERLVHQSTSSRWAECCAPWFCVNQWWNLVDAIGAFVGAGVVTDVQHPLHGLPTNKKHHVRSLLVPHVEAAVHQSLQRTHHAREEQDADKRIQLSVDINLTNLE